VVRIFPDGLDFSVRKSGVALEKPVQQVYRFSHYDTTFALRLRVTAQRVRRPVQDHDADETCCGPHSALPCR
jgi:hypothetical protein